MTSISSITNQIFNSYDRNGDGCISLKPGGKYEGSHTEREYQSSFDRDIITVTRYSHDKLFKAADKNNDGMVCKQEMADVIKLFDKNKDGKLTNSGPFWNRKGELRDFDKAYPEKAQILEQHIIPKPQPPIPHIPHQPYYPGYPNQFPGQPHQPFPHHVPRAYAGLSVGVSVG